jgi:predicted DsbA family dithiol-disulfide isomerase
VKNLHLARHYEIQAVPSFIFGERKLTGVVSEAVMRDAAEQLLSTA